MGLLIKTSFSEMSKYTDVKEKQGVAEKGGVSSNLKTSTFEPAPRLTF